MKIIHRYYDEDERDWKEEEIDKKRAKYLMDGSYTNIDELLSVECVYRIFWGEIITTK